MGLDDRARPEPAGDELRRARAHLDAIQELMTATHPTADRQRQVEVLAAVATARATVALAVEVGRLREAVGAIARPPAWRAER